MNETRSDCFQTRKKKSKFASQMYLKISEVLDRKCLKKYCHYSKVCRLEKKAKFCKKHIWKIPEVLDRKWLKTTEIGLKYRNLLKFDVFRNFGLHWPSLTFIGLFWPLMAFDDFFRLKEVFLSINQGQMTTFHQSDIENDYHSRFSKAVQSEFEG